MVDSEVLCGRKNSVERFLISRDRGPEADLARERAAREFHRRLRTGELSDLPVQEYQRVSMAYAEERFTKERMEFHERQREARRRPRRTETFDFRVSEALWEAIQRVSTEVYGKAGQVSRMVREISRQGLGMPSKDCGVTRRHVSAARRDVAVEVESAGRRDRKVKIRMSSELRNRLKEAAATATRPRGSMKLGSTARVIRELLREAFGMPSRDGSKTLSHLAEWRAARNTQGDPPPSATDDAELRLAVLAMKLVAEHDYKAYTRLIGDREVDPESGQRVPCLTLFSRRIAKKAFSVYEKKVEQYQRHLPRSEADKKAEAFIVENIFRPNMGRQLTGRT